MGFEHYTKLLEQPSHISMEIPGIETSNKWLEPVSDEYYNNLKDKG